jgi:uncharacterized protein YidB (DUF937 family)
MIMGLLDSIFGGGNDRKSGGGISPITLALLALLAYRTYQGKGRLADMLGRGQPDEAPAGGTTAGRTAGPGRLPGGNPDRPMGDGEGRGLGGILADIMRGGSGGRPLGGNAAGRRGRRVEDILRGGLGGLLGGAATGAILNSGLGDLFRQFQQHGQGDTANSWVSRGPNREITPQEIEQALGRDTLEELSAQTGTPYDKVLSDLSESLPDAVDRLTPEGRLPTEEEAARWV